MSRYEVIVENIGSVYDGEDQDKAYSIFKEYLDLSTSDYGSVSSEEVTAFKNGELWEPFPSECYTLDY